MSISIPSLSINKEEKTRYIRTTVCVEKYLDGFEMEDNQYNTTFETLEGIALYLQV